MTVRHLFDDDHNLIGVVAPRYLFRFVRDSEYLTSALTTPYLWFSSLRDFNDPLEFANRFRPDCEFALLKGYFREYLRNDELFNQVPWDFVETMPSMRSQTYAIWQAGMEGLFRLKLDQVSVCCSSDTPEIPLMWSHYADGHRGVCIVLDTLQLLRDGAIGIQEVNYVDNIVNWDHPRERRDFGETDEFNMRFDRAVLATKSSQWQYEREHRLISHTRGQVNVPNEAIVGVIVGSRMPEQRASQIIQSVRAMRSPQEPLIVTRALVDQATGNLWPLGLGLVHVVVNARFRFLPDDGRSFFVEDYFELPSLDEE